MTPGEFLAVLDDALVRGGGLELTAPIVLGVRGRYVGIDADGRPNYEFSPRKVRKMRRVIEAAARADGEAIKDTLTVADLPEDMRYDGTTDA